MFRILTQDRSEREQLEQDCLSGQGCLLAPAGQVQSVVGLVRSISYEYFRADLPELAAKVRDFAVGMLGMSCSLSLLREIMAGIRRQADLIKFYQKYLVAMDEQLAGQDFAGGGEEGGVRVGGAGVAFEPALQQKSTVRKKFSQEETSFQEGKPDGEGETATEKTEKTMQSEIIQAQNSILFQSTSNKFSQLLKTTLAPVSLIPTSKEDLSDSSVELRVFEKKGGSVMGNSIEALMRSQIEADLQRESASCLRGAGRHSEVEQFRYNRLIKDGLMNGKLKRRRR